MSSSNSLPLASSPVKRTNPGTDEDGALDSVLNPAANYPRKRVAIACEVCRARKTRCDAKRPCGFCSEAGVECVYRQSGQNEKYSTPTDILSRIEDRLARLEDIIVNKQLSATPTSFLEPGAHNSPRSADRPGGLRARDSAHQGPADRVSVQVGAANFNSNPNVRHSSHRTLSHSTSFDTSFRQTSAEAVTPRPSILSFQSPYYLDAPSWDMTTQYYDDQLLQQTELGTWVEKVRRWVLSNAAAAAAAADVTSPPPAVPLPPQVVVDGPTVYNLQKKFLDNILQWFPLFEMSFLLDVCERARAANWSVAEPATCLAMLVFAISEATEEGYEGGSSSTVNINSNCFSAATNSSNRCYSTPGEGTVGTGASPTGTLRTPISATVTPSGSAPPPPPQDGFDSPTPVPIPPPASFSTQKLLSERGLWYYGYAYASLVQLQLQKHDVFVMQCRILQAIYHNITFRTIAAWDATSELARDIMHFLSSSMYTALPGPSRESFNRVFWATSILLHELESALKMHPIGLQAYHDLVPLPYPSMEEEEGSRTSFYYFFAQVSIRKILTDALEIVGYRSASVVYAPIVTEELKTQAEKWYAALPGIIKFPLGEAPVFDLRKAYLRNQFEAMRVVMFWPGILKVLEMESGRAADDRTGSGIHNSSPATAFTRDSISGTVAGSKFDGGSASPAPGAQVYSSHVVDNDGRRFSTTAHPDRQSLAPTDAPSLVTAQKECRLCVESCVNCCYSATELLARPHLGLHLSIWITYASMSILLIIHNNPALAFLSQTTDPDPIRTAFRALRRWGHEPLLRVPLERAGRMLADARILV